MGKYTKLPNGRFELNQKRDRGYYGGYYVKADGIATDEEIESMKEAVVEKVCNQIREIAKTRDDFFIVHKGASFPGFSEEVTTVGVKYLLPTVKADI